MRILLDEQLPRQLVPFMVGHEVRTVQQESWAGLKNGALLTAAEAAGFAILLTGDQNLPFQQNLGKRRIGVVVFCAVSNAIEDLLPLVPDALNAIDVVQPGQVIRVETWRRSRREISQTRHPSRRTTIRVMSSNCGTDPAKASTAANT